MSNTRSLTNQAPRQRGRPKERCSLGLDNYNGVAERLLIVCDHYLDLGFGLREASDEIVIWPCLSCGQALFVANFDDGVAGCTEPGCETPREMSLSELIVYLDQDVPADDIKRANEKFAEIFEVAVGREREREGQRRERNRQARDERRRRKEQAKPKNAEQGFSEEQLF